MKIFCYPWIPIFLTVFISTCNGQTQAGLDAPVTPETISSSLQTSATSKPLRVCEPEDELSNSYCTCKDQVVSCDFSKYVANTTTADISGTGTAANDTNHMKNSSDHVELTLYGYHFPSTTSRFCICNTPPNLHLTFSKEYFLPISTNRIQRFDLFNLSGVTHFSDGFSLNFNGDLYIANVSRIPEISAFEFGRGNDDPIFNVQDKECCSPIKMNQNYRKPVLLIENSTIDHIRTRGLDDLHFWKTVVLKFNVFNTIEENGIIFDSTTGFDVAILRNKFKNVSKAGLVFKGASNLLMVKNLFRREDGVHPYLFQSRSALKDSNIVLIDNKFWNYIYMDMDARHIVSWYNLFDFWDNVTFASMNRTVFSSSFQNTATDRLVSVQYNIVAVPRLPEDSLDFGNESVVHLTDNVLGKCNCSDFMIMDKMVKPELNWCYTKNVNRANGKCSIRLDEAFKQCNKSQSVEFEHLCDDKKVSGPRFPGEGTNLTEDVHKIQMQINSTFLSRIVEEFHSLFGINRVIKDTDKKTSTGHAGDDDQHDENSATTSGAGSGKKKGTTVSNKESSQKSSVAIPIIVTMTVVVFIIVLGMFMFKYKHRFLRRSGHHELVDDSRNEMM